MSNVPMGANEQSNAPWNEKGSNTKLVGVKIFCEMDVYIEVEVNDEQQVYRDESIKIDNACSDIIQNSSEKLSYIDWDFLENDKFEK